MFKQFVIILICLFSSAVDAYSGVDPTKPLSATRSVSKAKQQTHLVLQSIIIDSQQKNRKAIVSGKLLKSGESINGYTLSRINDKSVVLKSAEREITLSLFSNAVVKTH